jgi:hypothetical protein
VNIHTRPEVSIRDNGFKLKPALINMVQASQFYGKTLLTLNGAIAK